MAGKRGIDGYGLWLLALIICFPLSALAEKSHEKVPLPAQAKKSFGEVLCGDTINYFCFTVGDQAPWLQISEGDTTQTCQETPAPKTPKTWETLWSDEREREIVRKVNRTNIDLQKGMILAVPRDMNSKTFMAFSPFPGLQDSFEETVLIFDPQLLAFAVYDPQGVLVRWGPAVGGKDYCSDVERSCRTRTGEFRIYLKGGPNYRSGKYPIGCSGNSCAKMPYAMFFTSGYAFHSGKLAGKHASHGCVRVFFSDAQWLDANIAKETKVIIRPYP